MMVSLWIQASWVRIRRLLRRQQGTGSGDQSADKKGPIHKNLQFRGPLSQGSVFCESEDIPGETIPGLLDTAEDKESRGSRAFSGRGKSAPGIRLTRLLWR